jgi:uncharacterized membrane protein
VSAPALTSAPSAAVAEGSLTTAGRWLSNHPWSAWAADRYSLTLPVAILAVCVWLWVMLFSIHVTWRHERFGTFDHDLGIWDQAIWLLSRGESFITVRGLDVFGFHASPALYLYVPFYWLGAGPEFLNTTMVVALSLGSIAIFRLARHHLRNDWYALLLALAFLVNYAGQWMLHETWHPEVMAVTPLLFAYLAATEGRWRAYVGWLVLAVAWKEDVALAAAMVGLLLVLRGNRTITGQPAPEGTRRRGLWTLAGCTMWFLFATQVLIPGFSEHGNFTEDLYGDLGDSPTEIAGTAATDPGIVIEHFQRSRPAHYVGDLAGSFGFAPLLAPAALPIALPQLLANLLAVYDFFWTTRVHYAAMPLAAMGIATVEAVARARSPGFRRFLLGCVAVGAFYTAISWGLTPWSNDYRKGFWPLEPGLQQRDFEQAVQLPDGDDSVSAAYNLVPHLTHRSEIYTFPNPWIPTNFGVQGENRPDPDDVEWIIVEPNWLNDFDKGVLVSALSDPAELLEPGEQAPPPEGLDFAALTDTDHWEVVVDHPDLFAVRRIDN